MNLVIHETLTLLMDKDTAITRKHSGIFKENTSESLKSVIKKLINHFANFSNS